MKNLFYAIFCFLVLPSFCFGQNNALQNFRQNIPLYASSAALLLTQTKVDPVVPDVISKVLPEVANENVDGAVQAVATILYERKNIKALDPTYTQYLDTKIRSLIGSVKSNDYTNIIASIADISVNTNNYIHNNFTNSSTNNNQYQSPPPARTYQPQGNTTADAINRNLKGPNGQTVYTGPKGGNYYLNSSGSKVYLRSNN